MKKDRLSFRKNLNNSCFYNALIIIQVIYLPCKANEIMADFLKHSSALCTKYTNILESVPESDKNNQIITTM